MPMTQSESRNVDQLGGISRETGAVTLLVLLSQFYKVDAGTLNIFLQAQSFVGLTWVNILFCRA